jgi:hypothetical protein
VSLILVRQLLVLLGSFWTRVFTSVGLLRSLFRGLLVPHSQSEQAVSELVASTSCKEVPAGQATSWHKFVLGIYGQTKVRYGDEGGYYGISYLYGQILDNRAVYDVDPDILSIPALYDSVIAPTKVLTEGIDYKLSSGRLIFRSPLSFSSEPVVLYARNMVRESGFVTSRLGYALNVQLSDKVYSKVPFESVWRIHTYGPNFRDLMRLLGAASGTPVTLQDEVVEYVRMADSVELIITDKAAYAVPASKSLDLQVGQRLPEGSPLTASLAVLHDKSPYVSDLVPEIYRQGKLFKYGDSLAAGSCMLVLKADISGEQAAALKILKNVTPPEIKVLVLSNVDIPAVSLSQANLSFTGRASESVLASASSLTNSNISVKASSRVRYSNYGY